MKKLLFSLCVACGALAAREPNYFCTKQYECTKGNSIELRNDITDQIPEIATTTQGFKKIPNVAQYKMADWSNVIGIARGITMNEAYKIANDNPDITFFFHMKGAQMVLEKEDGSYRVFRHGDTVFFSGDPWWGSAPGFSDGYVRVQP